VPPAALHSFSAALTSLALTVFDAVHVLSADGVGVCPNTSLHVNVVFSIAGASHCPLSNVAPGSSLHACSEPCSLAA
jgi:hypothetical protein